MIREIGRPNQGEQAMSLKEELVAAFKVARRNSEIAQWRAERGRLVRLWLAQNPGVSYGGAAKALKLPKTTVYRIAKQKD